MNFEMILSNLVKNDLAKKGTLKAQNKTRKIYHLALFIKVLAVTFL